MAIATYQTPLRAGVQLVRHFNNEYNVDQQCGPASYYQAIEDQLVYQALEYYFVRYANSSDVAYHKFLRRVTWHVYSWLVPMPRADWECYCEPPAADGEIHIHTRYYDPTTSDAGRLPGALSHETGHAFHFWAGLYAGKAALAEVERTWERMASTYRVTYDPNVYPWRQHDRLETPMEALANAYRYFFGTLSTRGSSGPGTRDPVLPGFADPGLHPEWRKAIQILPELCGFILAHGVRPGTLAWVGGTNGWWEFRRGTDGRLIAHFGYYDWFHRDDTGPWIAFQPKYTVN